MTPEFRFHSYVTVATIVVMYVAILYVVPFLMPPVGVSASDEPFTVPRVVAAGVGGLLGSVGVYTSLAKLLLATSRRLKFVKRHLLGASYLNGTWVGAFNIDSSLFFTVEHFEQNLSSLKIRGQARAADGTSYATWHSASETIRERDGRLEYTYELHRNNQVFSSEGLCRFFLSVPTTSARLGRCMGTRSTSWKNSPS